MAQAPVENRLLSRLADADRQRLLARAERVTVPVHQVVCEPGEPVPYAHFPLGCVFSDVVQMRDGSLAEAATVGNEGMVGIALLFDERASPYRVLQEVPGESLRIAASDFKAMLADLPSLRPLLERFLASIAYQSGRNAGCNLRHNIGQRLCRWLLMTHDRVPGDEFYLTHEDVSNMLGVRRQSVSEVAKPLQDAGLISYSRGNIKILDRPGLEKGACECYEAIWQNYDLVMGREH